MRERSVGDIVLIPPTGDAAACPTFVFGPAPGVVRLTAPGPFAPNVGTEPEEKPAVNGLVEPGAAVEAPGEGSNAFAPEPDDGEDTLIFVPVGFVGTKPPALVGY
jgi:hypothetical protein